MKKLLARRQIQSALFYQHGTPGESFCETGIENPLTKAHEYFQNELKAENEEVYREVSKHWDNLPVTIKHKVMAAEGIKGTIDYLPIDRTFSDSVPIVKSFTKDYRKYKVEETFGVNSKVEIIIKNWKKNTGESFYDLLSRLMDQKNIEERKIMANLELKKLVDKDVIKLEDVNLFQNSLLTWLGTEYEPKMTKHDVYEIVPFSALEPSNRLYKSGKWNMNGSLVSNGEQTKFITVEHGITYSEDRSKSRYSYPYKNNADFVVINVADKELDNIKPQILTKMTDAELNAKEVFISGIDYENKEFQHGLIQGRCFRLTSDFKNHTDYKEPGLFVILIETHEEVSSAILKGLSGSPVFYNNLETGNQEIVGNLSGTSLMKINEKYYQVIYFSGPSIIRKAFD